MQRGVSESISLDRFDADAAELIGARPFSRLIVPSASPRLVSAVVTAAGACHAGRVCSAGLTASLCSQFRGSGESACRLLEIASNSNDTHRSSQQRALYPPPRSLMRLRAVRHSLEKGQRKLLRVCERRAAR